MKLSIWATNPFTLLNEAPLSDLLARMENQISIWLSQDAWGRGVVEVDIRVPLQPQISLRLVSGKVVQDHVDFLIRMLRHNGVHKVEELSAPAALIVLPVTSPVPTCSAANKVVVPFRL